MSETQQNRLESALKLVSPFLAVGAFVWGIYTYRENSRQQLARETTDAQRTAETRRIEATRPFLDKQLLLYTEATKVASIIATSADTKEVDKATRRFKELYWGEMGLVEHGDVESAMVAFKNALDATANQGVLGPLALALARACRNELAGSWGTEAWKR